MKKIILILGIVLVNFSLVNAQYGEPVEWEFKYNKLSDDTYELICTAKIERLWHMYGQFFPEGGPTRLNFVYDDFKDNESYELIGVTEESPEPKTFQHPIFGMEVQYFTNEATFIQKIKLKKKTNIKVFIEGILKNKMTKMIRLVSVEHIFELN